MDLSKAFNFFLNYRYGVKRKRKFKKKLAINKKEFRATGGSPNDHQYIYSRDEAIAKICGFYEVEGIEYSASFGFQIGKDT